MEKTITIQGEIDLFMLDSVMSQISSLCIEKGDEIRVCIDSPGGDVDIALTIVKGLEALLECDVTIKTVASGRVFSSAIIIFIAFPNREVSAKGEFLVHQVSAGAVYDADKAALEAKIVELNEYADFLCTYYAEKGIAEDVIAHIKGGEELHITDPKAIEAAGFATVFSAAQSTVNNLKTMFSQLFGAKPKYRFSYINNIKKLNLMTDEKVATIVDEKLEAFGKGLLSEIKNLVQNQMSSQTEPIQNEATSMTSDEMEKLAGEFYKTPVTMEGNDEVKALVHPTQDVEKDHFVIPINEDGEIVKLSAGDHPVKVGETDRVIHSTGKDYYIHTKAVDNKTETEMKNEEEKEETKTEETKTETEETTEVEDKKESKAPNVTNRKPDLGSGANEAAEAFFCAVKEVNPLSVGKE